MLLSIKFQARNRFLERGKAVEKCFKCGTCALMCPVTRYGEGYNLRETFMYDIFSSEEPSAKQNLWSCSVCYKCYEVCPQDVNPPKVFRALKEIAFETGRAPLSVASLVKSVIHTGMSFPMSDASRRMRAQLNLPSFAPKDVDDLGKIAKNTGLERKLDILKAKRTNEHE